MMTSTAARWGTWEELLLGGAVLRHGAAAWDAVAAELQARTPFPHLFSAQVCEAKFEELQERYSGSDFWFEELRKRRVAELKKELERSEDSIGSLHAKLENLSSHGESGSSSRNSERMTSSSPTEKACDNDSFIRDMSKDGSSAGSFTQETHGDLLSTSNIVDSASVRVDQLKMAINSDEKDETKNLTNGYVSFKKKRGKRKRRFCITVKEGSTGDSEIIDSVACTHRSEVLNGCEVDGKTPNGISSSCLSGELNMDMRPILDSIVENKDFSIFQRRLESQKKPRYKKLIRQHVDFLTIRKGILNGSISSMREFFRELLLLSNNVLVFFPKDSAEYKSALTILKLAKKMVGKSSRLIACSNPYKHDISSSVVKDESKGVAGIGPCNQNVDRKIKLPSEGAKSPKPKMVKKRSQAGATVESPIRKRAIGRPAKEGQRSGRSPDESSNKGRKRARRS